MVRYGLLDESKQFLVFCNPKGEMIFRSVPTVYVVHANTEFDRRLPAIALINIAFMNACAHNSLVDCKMSCCPSRCALKLCVSFKNQVTRSSPYLANIPRLSRPL